LYAPLKKLLPIVMFPACVLKPIRDSISLLELLIFPLTIPIRSGGHPPGGTVFSDVLAIRRSVFAFCMIVAAISSPAGASEAERETEVENPIAFDIPAQSLSGVLEAYGRTSGTAALFDHALVAGQHSPGVKGLLTNDQALRILLAGTGLTARYVGKGAFTLEAAGVGGSSAASLPPSVGSGQEFRDYFGELQDDLIRTLCLRKETWPGQFRLGLQLWIGPDGRVLASHLLDPADDEYRAGVIEDLLRTSSLAIPPSNLPQPVTIVLLPRSTERNSECVRGQERSR
jgi:hypothetical protein